MADDATQVIRIIVDASAAKAGSDDARQHLKNIEDQAKSTGATIDAMSKSIEGMAGRLQGMIVAAAVGYLTSIAKGSLEAAAGLEVLSEQLGIGTDFLQSLKSAAAESGMPVDNLEQSFMRFSRTVGTAAEGNKKSIDLFNSMGVNILDSSGKLRSTESIFVDFAKSITAMNDPAMKVTDSMAAMGRGGSRMIPVMGEVAQGVDALRLRAVALGTTIDSDVIEKLHKLEAQSETTKLQLQALFANSVADFLSDQLQKTRNDIAQLVQDLKNIGDFLSSHSIADWFITNVAAPIAGGISVIGAAFSGLPDLFRAAFASAMNAAIAEVEKGLNIIAGSIGGLINNNPVLSRIFGDVGNMATVSLPRIGANNSATPAGDYLNGIGSAYSSGRDAFLQQNLSNDAYAGLAGPQSRGAQGSMIFGASAASPPGAGNPSPASKAGENLAKTLAKQLADAQIALDGATAGAAAASQGADAVAKLAEHTKDLTEVTNAYIKSGAQVKIIFDQQTGALTTNNAAVNKQVAALDALADATRGMKTLGTFILQTGDMKVANDNLALQLSLTGQTTEEIARQLDQRKALDQETKDGLVALAASNLDGAAAAQKSIQDRAAAIDQQYQIKTAIDATAKSQQLWLSPISGALSGIQSGAATLFETILKGGTVTWQSLADTIKSIFIKLFAELAVLAVVRPILAPIVNGLFSPGTAQQLGYGQGVGGIGGLTGLFSAGGVPLGAQGTGAGIPSVGGIGGLGSMFGSSGSGFFSSIGSFLNTPFAGAYSGVSPVAAGEFGPAPNTTAGGLLGSDFSVSPFGALGAAAGAGYGAYQLLTGGGSTASTIGGISSLVGAGVSLIPGIGQIAGPLIGLAGSLFGGLLGGGEPPPPINQAQGNLMFGGGGFGTNGVATGPDANSGPLETQLKGVASGISSIFDALGGVKDPSKVFGLSLQSFAQGKFSNQTSFIVGPDGSRQQWGQGSTAADVGLATGSAKVALESILNGAVGTITDNLRTALKGLDNLSGGATLNQIQTAVTDIQNFDAATKNLGKTVTASQQSLDQINTTFVSLDDTANKYGLDIGKLDAAKQAAEMKVATDFGDSLSKQILAITDPTRSQLTDLATARQTAMDNNAYIVGNVTGAPDQTSAINQLYSLQAQGIATTFMSGITAGTKGILDPVGAQIDAIQATWDKANTAAKAISDQVGASFVNMAAIAQYYTLQEEQVRKQYYASDVAALQSAIQAMTYGSLSGASPIDTLMGAKGTYTATLAQANAGSKDAIDALSNDASSYITAAQTYYGNTKAFADLVAQVRAQLANEQATLQVGGPGATGAPSNEAVNAVLQSNSTLSDTVTAQQQSIQALTDQIAQLRMQMQRVAVNQAA